MIKDNNHEVHKIIKNKFLESDIYPRIIFLGSHGSSLFKKIEAGSESDIDIELVLDKPKLNDYLKIRKIIQQIPIRTECQLRYLSEFNKGKLIDLSNYKIFMYFVYANGVTLHGVNIYKKIIKNLSPDMVKNSLLISSQIAFKDIRKVYLNSGTIYETNKQIIRFFVCFALYSGCINFRKLGSKDIFLLSENGDILDLILEYFPGVFSGVDRKIITDFKKSLVNKEINEKIFPIINKFVDRVNFL